MDLVFIIGSQIADGDEWGSSSQEGWYRAICTSEGEGLWPPALLPVPFSGQINLLLLCLPAV